MEEKERYYIENDMIIDEEKRINGEQDITICDTDDLDRAIYLLNQQDKRIKELEEKNKVDDFWHSAYQGKQLEYDQIYAELRKAYEEIQQLKQSQKQLAVGELEKLHQIFWDTIKTGILRSYVCSIINKQIKELKGEE